MGGKIEGNRDYRMLHGVAVTPKVAPEILYILGELSNYGTEVDACPGNQTAEWSERGQRNRTRKITRMNPNTFGMNYSIELAMRDKDADGVYDRYQMQVDQGQNTTIFYTHLPSNLANYLDEKYKGVESSGQDEGYVFKETISGDEIKIEAIDVYSVFGIPRSASGKAPE